MKKIIAIIGRAGCGKDFAGDYLGEKLGIPHYQISSSLRIIAKKQGIEESRENLINLGKQVTSKYGDDYLAKVLVENSDSAEMIISGMRQIGQLKYCNEYHNTLFIGIESASKIRYKRLIKNKKFSDTYENFLQVETLDEGEVQNVGKCLEFCETIIENNSTRELFEEKLFFVLQKFLGKNQSM